MNQESNDELQDDNSFAYGFWPAATQSKVWVVDGDLNQQTIFSVR